MQGTECDESNYLMELLLAAGIGDSAQLASQIAEANEILSILVARIRTTRAANHRLYGYQIVNRQLEEGDGAAIPIIIKKDQ
jgi:hypothetical protein